MAKLNGVKTLDMVNGEITKVVYNGEEYARVEGKAEVGDVALIINGWGTIENGDFYSVEKVERNSINEYVHISKRANGHQTDVQAFRKSSASTLPTIEKRVDDLESRVSALEVDKSETNRLTIGDIAKVVNKQYCHNAKVGDIVKIVDDEKDTQPYLCEFLDGSNAGWFGEEELIVLSAEEAKWAKIGRKVNEFKKGDIAKGYSVYRQKFAMGIVEVVSGKLIGIRLPNDDYYAIENSELIAPVESLFQR